MQSSVYQQFSTCLTNPTDPGLVQSLAASSGSAEHNVATVRLLCLGDSGNSGSPAAIPVRQVAGGNLKHNIRNSLQSIGGSAAKIIIETLCAAFGDANAVIRRTIATCAAEWVIAATLPGATAVLGYPFFQFILSGISDPQKPPEVRSTALDVLATLSDTSGESQVGLLDFTDPALGVSIGDLLRALTEILKGNLAPSPRDVECALISCAKLLNDIGYAAANPAYVVDLSSASAALGLAETLWTGWGGGNGPLGTVNRTVLTLRALSAVAAFPFPASHNAALQNFFGLLLDCVVGLVSPGNPQRASLSEEAALEIFVVITTLVEVGGLRLDPIVARMGPIFEMVLANMRYVEDSGPTALPSEVETEFLLYEQLPPGFLRYNALGARGPGTGRENDLAYHLEHAAEVFCGAAEDLEDFEWTVRKAATQLLQLLAETFGHGVLAGNNSTVLATPILRPTDALTTGAALVALGTLVLSESLGDALEPLLHTLVPRTLDILSQNVAVPSPAGADQERQRGDHLVVKAAAIWALSSCASFLVMSSASAPGAPTGPSLAPPGSPLRRLLDEVIRTISLHQDDLGTNAYVRDTACGCLRDVLKELSAGARLQEAPDVLAHVTTAIVAALATYPRTNRITSVYLCLSVLPSAAGGGLSTDAAPLAQYPVVNKFLSSVPPSATGTISLADVALFAAYASGVPAEPTPWPSDPAGVFNVLTKPPYNFVDLIPFYNAVGPLAAQALSTGSGVVPLVMKLCARSIEVYAQVKSLNWPASDAISQVVELVAEIACAALDCITITLSGAADTSDGGALLAYLLPDSGINWLLPLLTDADARIMSASFSLLGDLLKLPGGIQFLSRTPQGEDVRGAIMKIMEAVGGALNVNSLRFPGSSNAAWALGRLVGAGVLDELVQDATPTANQLAMLLAPMFLPSEDSRREALSRAAALVFGVCALRWPSTFARSFTWAVPGPDGNRTSIVPSLYNKLQTVANGDEKRSALLGTVCAFHCPEPAPALDGAPVLCERPIDVLQSTGGEISRAGVQTLLSVVVSLGAVVPVDLHRPLSTLLQTLKASWGAQWQTLADAVDVRHTVLPVYRV